MNATQKKLGLMAAMYAMAVTSPNIIGIDHEQTSTKPAPTPEWKRKKCKSCSSFPCRAYLKPLHEACEKYNKRKN